MPELGPSLDEAFRRADLAHKKAALPRGIGQGGKSG